MPIVAGIDEVGRGAFAGPLVVVCAAFQLESDWDPSIPCPVPGVKDSKKYSKVSKREEACRSLIEYPGLLVAGMGSITNDEINEHGMSWAMKEAIRRAITQVVDRGFSPDIILLDGHEKAHGWAGKQASTPKADSLWWPVSAASVLAKVYRDGLMAQMNSVHPGYGFGTNSGYGTPDHIAALRKLGPCPLHRTSFIRSSLE